MLHNSKSDLCPVCLSNEYQYSFTTDDKLYSTVGNYDVGYCNTCRTYSLLPMPNGKFLASLYDEKSYYSFNQGQNSNFYTWLRKKTRRLMPEKTYYEKSFCDIGCGDGEVIKIVRELGYKVCGTEQENLARKIADQTGLDVRKSILDFPRNFDIIRTNHCLEHVEDINDTFSDIKRKLSDDGRLYIGVPNAEGIVAKVFGKFWYYRGIPFHTYGFSEQSFEYLANKHKLKIVRVTKRQTFRGTFGSLLILLQSKWFGKSIEPTNKIFLAFMPLILIFTPLHLLLTTLKKGDLLELELQHDKT